MVAPIVAAEAAKRAKSAGNGLTGDMFVQRWTKTVGKGKNAKVIERELHLNPVVLGVGGALTTVGLITALWLAQLRVTPVQQADGSVKFAIKERRGFTVLGGDTVTVPDALSPVAKPWWDVAKLGSPIVLGYDAIKDLFKK